MGAPFFLPMTLPQYLQRITRPFTRANQDVTQIGAAESTRVYDALNASITEWFDKAPNFCRVSEDAVMVNGPLPITVTVTQFSKTFTISTSFPVSGYGYGANTDLIGNAIVINGDDRLNHVQSYASGSGQLWRPYLGATGSVTGTVYDDAIAFGPNDYMVVGPVIWTGTGFTQGIPLPNWNEMNPWLAGTFPEAPRLIFSRPTHYIADYHRPLDSASTSSAIPYWYLRIWPLPAFQGNVSYKIQSQPAIYTDADRTTQRAIPIPDQFVPLVCDLAIEKLIGSPLWNPSVDKQAAKDDAARQRIALQKLSSSSRDTARRSCGTPKGF